MSVRKGVQITMTPELEALIENDPKQRGLNHPEVTRLMEQEMKNERKRQAAVARNAEKLPKRKVQPAVQDMTPGALQPFMPDNKFELGEEPFTEESLAALIRNCLPARSPYSVPEGEALLELVNGFNRTAEVWYDENVLKPLWRKKAREARDAFVKLQCYVAWRRSNGADSGEATGDFGSDEAGFAASIESSIQAFFNITFGPGGGSGSAGLIREHSMHDPVGPEARTRDSVIWGLATSVQLALRDRNGRTAGISSNDSPVSRIVAEAMKIITGDELSATTVARLLRERRAEEVKYFEEREAMLRQSGAQK